MWIKIHMLIAPFEAHTHCWTSQCHRPTLQSLLLGYRQRCFLVCWVVQPFPSLLRYNIEFLAKIPCLSGSYSISMGLLQVCVWIIPLWCQVKPLRRAQHIGHLHVELLREPPSFHLSQAAGIVPITPYQAFTWPCVPCFPPFPATRQSETVTSPPQRRWGLETPSTAEVGRDNELTFQWRSLFFPPFLIAQHTP